MQGVVPDDRDVTQCPRIDGAVRPHRALHQVTALVDGPRRPAARGHPDKDADDPGYDPSASNRNHCHAQHYTHDLMSLTGG